MLLLKFVQWIFTTLNINLAQPRAEFQDTWNTTPNAAEDVKQEELLFTAGQNEK